MEDEVKVLERELKEARELIALLESHLEQAHGAVATLREAVGDAMAGLDVAMVDTTPNPGVCEIVGVSPVQPEPVAIATKSIRDGLHNPSQGKDGDR